MADYGSYGAYGDGGFDQGETSFQQDQQSSQRQGTRSSLTPVTIKQINDSSQPLPDADFQINGVNLNMVSFVGVLRKVDNGNSATTLTIEDGTGALEVRKWIDDNTSSVSEESTKYADMKDKYVYVTGSLKEFSSKKAVQNANITEVTDHNQVLYHNLSAISVHITSQGITKKSENALFVGNDDVSHSAGSQEEQVFSTVSSNAASMPEGVPLQLIAQKLNITADEAFVICTKLVEEGRFYTAYDDRSFLAI
ncbi:Replication factor A protein 2 [Yamadazyma tenuis]|uniref:Replication protein A, subunit RPA32 n=1 Tax=Candida tenuis (strain ATCC 10573 / BCRC 21748 / CBS 615 / JCM 9827 / NBRC 10315 / NRRL Y-1498 / VKM Y-70) TaxID=590646 RepID=G3B157_CANTC|nr:replication protein A, subunit RPA32 [Yamadazyma tenuis ATCC 10573]EGV64885.1 replication protein A, subunit RPA32 [Yamadazyma tenuis ATCC 10573]WEJ97679.1 Replication factor A protein 2 [Yamadazyma tenuis]